MKFWSDILSALFPEYCLGCGCVLPASQEFLCIYCRSELSQTDFTQKPNNEFEKVVRDIPKVGVATSLLYFKKEGVTQQLIHHLKYKRMEKIGAWLGGWLGEQMKIEPRFSHIDMIVPVPIHREKLKKRGYNQVTLFGKKLAESLEISYVEDVLVRVKNTKSQTQQSKEERWKSVKDAFRLENNSIFVGKNVLLIDDVYTTGATMKACAYVIAQSEVASINFATMTFVEQFLPLNPQTDISSNLVNQ